MPYTIPEYIEIKTAAGNTVAFLSPESDSIVAWIDDEQNGTCTIEIELPLACEKWVYFTDQYRIYADGKEFVISNPDAVDKQRDGKKLTGKIKAHESWILLGKKYQTISNDPQNTSPAWGAVIIVSGGAASGGFDPGSAGSALSYLLNGTDWTVGTVDATGIFDLETEKESVLANINKVQEKWGGILVWDSMNKTVSLRDEATWQNYTGYQIRYAKNLKGINRVDDYDIVTRLYPFGENDLNISTVNGGLLYLDNQSYSTDVLEGVWYNQDITDQTQLKTQGEKQLAVMCRPRHNYKTEVLDLRSLPGYGHETFARSDMADLFDEEFGANARVRIIRYRHNVFQSWLCDMELGDPLEKIAASVAQSIVMANFYKNVVSPNTSFQNLLKAIINTEATEINGATGNYTCIDGVSTWLDPDNTDMVRITPKGMVIAEDGGLTPKTVISGKGIHADAGWVGKLNAGVVQIGAATTFEAGYDPTKITADSVGMGVDADCLGLWHFDGSLNSHKGVMAETDFFTKLLLHMDGSDNGTTFTDECGKTVTRYGAVTKTGVKKFGTASGYFDGGESTQLEITGLEAIGTGDYTVECWIYLTAINKYSSIFEYSNFPSLRVNTSNKLAAPNSSGIVHPATLTTNTWYHVAIIRYNGYTNIYINGVGGTAIEDSWNYTATALKIGEVWDSANGYNFSGYIDEIRISKGIARWTSDFIPPSVPYTKFDAGCFGQALNGYAKAPTAGLSASQGTINFRAKNLSASANGSVLVDLPKSDNSQGILAGIASDGRLYIKGATASTVYGPNKSTLTAWDSISLAWKSDRLSLVVNDTEACYIETPSLPSALGSYLFIGTDRNGFNAINTLVDELRIDKVYKEVAIRTAWHKAGSPFYTSEDAKQWPGYLKAVTDGIEIYDSEGNLRAKLGSWLKNLLRKYGLKIIDGEIYSSLIRSGAEDATTYIQFTPPNNLEVYYNGALQMLIQAVAGGGIYFYKNGEIISKISGATTGADIGIFANDTGTVAINGDLNINGGYTASGSKSAMVPTLNYGIVKLYGVEAPEVLFYDRDRAQLVNGECTVYLDPVYLECIEPDTELTPWLFKTEVYGLGENIRVVEWGENYFKVKEENGGISNRKFGWWFEATRKNYAGIRLMEVFL